MSKQEGVKLTNLKKLPKIKMLKFARNFTRDTPSAVAQMYIYQMDPTKSVEAT